jgi:hypothetical protein
MWGNVNSVKKQTGDTLLIFGDDHGDACAGSDRIAIVPTRTPMTL